MHSLSLSLPWGSDRENTTTEIPERDCIHIIIHHHAGGTHPASYVPSSMSLPTRNSYNPSRMLTRVQTQAMPGQLRLLLVGVLVSSLLLLTMLCSTPQPKLNYQLLFSFVFNITPIYMRVTFTFFYYVIIICISNSHFLT